MDHLYAGRRGQREFHDVAVGQGCKQAESRCTAQQAAGKHISGVAGKAAQVGAERSHDVGVSGDAHGKVVFVGRKAEVRRVLAVGQVRNHIVGHKNRVYIHCRRIGGTVQHGDVHVVRVGGRFLSGWVDNQIKRRGRVAHDTGSRYDVGFAFFQVHVERGDGIGGRGAVARGNAQRNVHAGGYIDERCGRAVSKIVDQQVVVGVHVHHRRRTVVNHLNTGKLGRRHQRQFEHRAVGQRRKQTEARGAVEQAARENAGSASGQTAQVGPIGSQYITGSGRQYLH